MRVFLQVVASLMLLTITTTSGRSEIPRYPQLRFQRQLRQQEEQQPANYQDNINTGYRNSFEGGPESSGQQLEQVRGTGGSKDDSRCRSPDCGRPGLRGRCQTEEVPPNSGIFKSVCNSVHPNLRKQKTEHILWLLGNGGRKQIVDIEVPNYLLEELIKAGFKTHNVSSTEINILLKRPYQNVSAAIEQSRTPNSPPLINIEYEQPIDTSIHFPTEQKYSELTEPLRLPSGEARVRRDILIPPPAAPAPALARRH